MREYPISDGEASDLATRFTYHPPSPDQVARYAAIRAEAFTFAEVICRLTPRGRERQAALGKLDSAVMLANAAIARGESS